MQQLPLELPPTPRCEHATLLDLLRWSLILADAFYEWRKGAEPKAPKQPYAIRMADGRPFAIAGLWEAS